MPPFEGLRGAIEAKLRSLRVEFGRKMRELNKPSGSQGGKKRPWRFMNSLMFLRDCIMPRCTTSNLNVSLSTSTTSVTTDSEDGQLHSDISTAEDAGEPNGSVTSEVTAHSADPPAAKRTSCTPEAVGVGPKKKPRLSADKEEAATSALHCATQVMSSVCQRMAQSKPQQQPCSNAARAFCDMLYHQLMSLMS